MKKTPHALVPMAALYAATLATSLADPQLDSWMTDNSGKYARVYKRASSFTPDLTTTYTTWGAGGSTEQANPVYADIQRVRYSAGSVYVEASGLASHVMGPWYKPNGDEYVSWPTNQQLIFRIPRTPSVASVPRATVGGGYAGVFVNGMAVFNSLDGKAWESTDVGTGQYLVTDADHFWYRLAPVAEDFNFDAGNAHQPPTGIYHAHQSPIALRYQLGDHVDYDAGTNTYSEKTTAPTAHSPIIGWAPDGYPIYGPYGYDDPNDSASGIRRMVSGFVVRNGANGTDGLGANRTVIPQWYARFRQEQGIDAVLTTNVSAKAYGQRPALSAQTRGTFAQDYSYLGDLTNPSDGQPFVQGEDFDLNEQNCRWCKTPEFPSGTYAYFVTLDSSLEPTFPYVVGFEFWGTTNNQYGDVNSVSESVTTYLVAGPNADVVQETPSVDSSNDEVTLAWNIVEGGTYTVESSSDGSSWSTEDTIVAGQTTAGASTFVGNGGDGFARVTRSAIATYDAVLTSAPSSTQTDTEAYSTPAEPVSVVYVNAARSGEAVQDGASWATAFADLQDAIASATSGQEIWVAAGIYYPDEAEAGVATVTNNDEYSFYILPVNIPIYGGFAGTEIARSQRDWKTNVTIFSGDLEQNDTTTNGIVVSDPLTNIVGTNARSIVTGSGLTQTLDGVVITASYGGNAIGGGGNFRNCTVLGNYGSDAGALYQEGEVFSMVSCDILNNVGGSVGGVSAAGSAGCELISCKIHGNKALSVGNEISVGGVHAGGGGSLQITNCLIAGNYGYNNGGILVRGGGTMNVDNTTIAHNYAASSASNYAEAGGVGSDASFTGTFENVLIWGNVSNSTENNVNGEFSFYQCLIEGVDADSTEGNLDGTNSANDPQFMSPVAATSAPSSAGDYRVPGTSPVVDAGSSVYHSNDTADLDEDGNTGELLPLDLAGNSREINVTDIGAYEYAGPTVSSPITSNVEVEVGATGTVDAVNLDALFGGDYTYSAVVQTAGVLGSFNANSTTGKFEVSGPFGAVGSTTLVTITATDADGYFTTATFTIEITATYVPSDSLSQSLGSWYTDRSSRFARIYETYADESAQNAVTTWDNGTYSQSVPVYGGPQKVSYTNSYVFVKTANLATHTMGPWYNDSGVGGSLEVFRNWPTNQDFLYQIPRVPAIPTAKTDFPSGAIGLMVDGTVIFSTTDTFSWDNDEDGSGNGSDTGPTVIGGGLGDGIWLHEAVQTEGNTFDKSNSHGAGDQLHYHGSPMGLRYLLGDNLTYSASTNTYTPVLESDGAFNQTHSPILGWMNDGLPLYGPFGYSNPNDATSGVRRMVSGFIKRDGANGTYNLTTNGRNRLPDWVATARGVSAALTINEQGPSVSSNYPVGYFMEDYEFKGNVSGYSYYEGVGDFNEAQHYDLNEYNVRFCVTPEFPNGTWAYFTNIDATGAVTFPYNVAQQYFGDPSNGGTISTVPTGDGDETQHFIGGASVEEVMKSTSVDAGDVTLTWSVAEGGTYLVESSTDLSTWSTELVGQVADSETLGVAETMVDTAKFYRISRTSEPVYDGSSSGGGGGASNVTFDFTFATTPPLPQQSEITSATVGGASATILSYNSGTGAVQLSFDTSALSSGSHSAQLSFVATGGPMAGNTVTLTSSNSYTK